MVGKDGAHGHFSIPVAPGDTAGRAVVVDIDGDDVIVELDNALRVRVTDGVGAASFNFARQTAPDCAVFSYHQVAVTGRWAFVFGHAIEALEKSGGYQLDGKTPIHSSTEKQLVTIVVEPR